MESKIFIFLNELIFFKKKNYLETQNIVMLMKIIIMKVN